LTVQTQHHWRDTILAGLANYIDAGSIVAGSVALAFWQEQYQLSPGFLGLLGAFGPNAIGAGIGALVGGILCDRLGRKTIYQWDMLIYAAGMALLVFAVAPWMIVAGFLIVSLGVFSFFVPLLTATGFTTLAVILTGFLVASGVIGYAWAPRNEGKSLEQLETERHDGF
jgi:MFS family permease